jgi:FkbM family methyltransferase
MPDRLREFAKWCAGPRGRAWVQRMRVRRLHARQFLFRRLYRRGRVNVCNGVQVFTSFTRNSEWYEPPSVPVLEFEQRIIRFSLPQVDGTGVLDIGAHHGFFSGFLLDLLRSTEPLPNGAGWLVLALEPDAEAFAVLEKTIALYPNTHQIEAINAALGHHTGMIATYETEMPCMSTFNYKGTSRKVGTISCLSLDECKRRYFPEVRIGFIKIDIDGFEEALFKGEADTLTSDHPVILMEYVPTLLEDSEVDPQGFLADLLDRYQVYWCRHQDWSIQPIGMDAYARIREIGGITNLLLVPNGMRFDVDLIRAKCALGPVAQVGH